MLMTPISPNTMESPSAISTRTVNRLRPLKTCMAIVSNVMCPLTLGWDLLPLRVPSWSSDELGERVRLDQLRVVEDLHLTVGAELADAGVLPEMVVALVELDLPLGGVPREL